ncbi:hypothetical protein J0H58_25395 [bacterium]|nr:hypothetical protein [bacterium]
MSDPCQNCGMPKELHEGGGNRCRAHNVSCFTPPPQPEPIGKAKTEEPAKKVSRDSRG